MAGVFDSVEDAAGERTERLIRAHDVQVEVRFDFEVLQGVVEHGPVLTGVDDGRLEFSRTAAQFMDDQGQLDCFWPRA
jgi:hypothetical protein